MGKDCVSDNVTLRHEEDGVGPDAFEGMVRVQLARLAEELVAERTKRRVQVEGLRRRLTEMEGVWTGEVRSLRKAMGDGDAGYHHRLMNAEESIKRMARAVAGVQAEMELGKLP